MRVQMPEASSLVSAQVQDELLQARPVELFELLRAHEAVCAFVKGDENAGVPFGFCAVNPDPTHERGLLIHGPF